MKRRYSDLPGWSFEIAEVSAGVFHVKVSDSGGRSVSKTGVDPEELLEQCRKEVADLVRGTGPASHDQDI